MYDYINPIDAPYYAVGDFNFSTLTGTVDNAAIQAAMNAAVAQGKVLRITRVHKLDFTDTTGGTSGSIRMPEGLVMICDPGCGFAYDKMYCPVLWKQGPGALTIRDLAFYFFGTVPIDASPFDKWKNAAGYWGDYEAQRAGSVVTSNPGNMQSISGNDVRGTPLVICGGKLDIRGLRFQSLAPDSGLATDTRRFFYVCMSINDANDGSMVSGVIKDTYIDGANMGIVGTAWDNLTIDGLDSYRYGYGGLDASWSYNPAPPHVIYHTWGDGTKRGTVHILNVRDHGIDRAEVNGAGETLKITGAARATVRGGFSKRPHGAISWICEDADIEYSGVMSYPRIASTANNGGAPIRALTNTVGGVVVKNGGRIKLKFRVTGTPSAMIQISAADKLRIDLDLSVDVLTSLGLVVANTGTNPAATNCLIRAHVKSDAPGVMSSPANWFNASVGNRVEVESHDMTNLSAGIGNLRAIEQDPAAASNNTLKFTDLNDGSTLETFANGLALIKRSKVVQQPATSGASVNVSGFIPAGARNVIIIPVVKTALGATNGTSGFTVGVTGDTARFAAVSGTAVGSGSAGAYTARAQSSAAPWQYAAAQDVLITPTGGNFDGTGVIQLTIYYEIASQSAYAY